MKAGMPLTPISLLHPITSEDEDFAMKVYDEYSLPYDELCWLIRDIRDTLNDGFSAFKKDSRFRDTYNELFASDVEIKGITINTNKEDIFIKTDSSLFDYFLNQIQKIHSEIEKKIDDQDHYLPAWSKINALLKTDFYISDTSLGPFQKNVVIGMFLFHFRLDRGKPLLSQLEFKSKQEKGEFLGYDSYKHYLAEAAERRLEKFSFDPNI
jgi:hypothetical protein